MLAIPKCKSYRSSIPRLERWKKCKNSGTAKVETKRAEHNVERKTPKRAKATPGGDGDILLMNLDVEEDKGSKIPFPYRYLRIKQGGKVHHHQWTR